jgi:apolipoprotein N-acyltransferase
MSWKNVFGAGLAALLTALAFPHWGIWLAGWVGLVPLLWALRNLSPREAVLIGWTAGVAHFGLMLYWLVATIQSYGGLPIFLAVPVYLLLIIYLGAFWAAFGGLTRFVQTNLGVPLIVLAPPLWCALEYLRGALLTGFPWGLLGYSQWQVMPIVQIADLTGIYGVSFLMVLVNVSVWLIVGRVFHIDTDRPRIWIAPVAAALLVGATCYYGTWRLPRVLALSREAPALTVGIAQGNIEQMLKWDPAFQEATMEIYERLTERLAQEGVQLVVWPETSAPFFFQVNDEWQARLKELARTTGTEILFGSPAFAQEGGHRVFFNRAYLLSPKGRILDYYDKTHLVPFGEYVPLKPLLSFLYSVVENIGDFSPGKDLKPIQTTLGARIGVMICFESIFPEIGRKFVQNGADLLANLTNDAWFGDTAAPYQHLSILTLRAIENRRWIVRAANTGISAFIGPDGRIRREIPLFRRGSQVDKVQRLRIKSFYSIHGDLFVTGCSLWASGLLLMSLVFWVVERRR